MKIDVEYRAYHPDNPASPGARWDFGFLEYMLFGGGWRPPGGFQFEVVDELTTGGIIIFPGSYIEQGIGESVASWLTEDLKQLAWSIVFAVSDECQMFPWHQVTLPANSVLYVQEPNIARRYPDGTRFMPLGPQTAPRPYDPQKRDILVHFRGQTGYDSPAAKERWQMRKAIDEMSKYQYTTGEIVTDYTAGFTQGIERPDYLAELEHARFVPCPGGPCTPDTFRFYEALDAGAIPIKRHDPYWRRVGLDKVGESVGVWHALPENVQRTNKRFRFNAAKTSAAWQQYKRNLAFQISDDIRDVIEPPIVRECQPITAIVLTSPVPSNPDLSMIQTTIASVRERLPSCEILVMCDGVRPEQEERRENYETFLHELAQWCNTQRNVIPFVSDEHIHQSGLIRMALNETRSPFVLMMEHDTPLEGEIPFDDLVIEMDDHLLNQMRFSHEASILPVHMHLFLPPQSSSRRWTPTFQFSMRPHLSPTEWYRAIVLDLLSPKSKTFIEDAIYGLVVNSMNDPATGGTFASRKQLQEAWERFRLAVFTPKGDIKRSGNLDGRQDDPKYPIEVAWVGDTPDGAVQPGVHHA